MESCSEASEATFRGLRWTLDAVLDWSCEYHIFLLLDIYPVSTDQPQANGLPSRRVQTRSE